MKQYIHSQSIIIVAGFDRYGSGKYMRDMADALECLSFQLTKISTNRMRLGGLWQILRQLLGEGRRDVVFQPSISGLSFFRDILILLILMIFRCNVSLVVLSHIFYKNKLFRLAWVRSLFFKSRHVIGAADIKEIRDLAKKFDVVTPVFTMPFSTGERAGYRNVNDILFCYIGYFDAIKGFDRFVALAEKHVEMDFVAVGDPISEDINIPDYIGNIQFSMSTSERSFSENVSALFARDDCQPVLIYSSRFDLAPFLILELGAARLPVCVQKDTDSYQILKNFLPDGAFYLFTDLSDVVAASRTGQLLDCTRRLEEFCRQQGRARFNQSILKYVECWKNDAG